VPGIDADLNAAQHGQAVLAVRPFEALVYGDALAYTNFSKFNKPRTIPLAYGTEIKHGCTTAVCASTISSMPALESLKSTMPAR
jgi:hypothetical protein